MNQNDYDTAISLFFSVIDYSDSAAQISQSKYNKAVNLKNLQSYDDAMALFAEIIDFSDANEQITECTYLKALSLINAGDYSNARAILTALSGYQDSDEQLVKIEYLQAVDEYNAGNYFAAMDKFMNIWPYQDAYDYIRIIASRNYEYVSVGTGQTAVLHPDGTVSVIGNADHNKADVDDWTNIVAVSAGNWCTMGLKDDGRVVCTVGTEAYGLDFKKYLDRCHSDIRVLQPHCRFKS